MQTINFSILINANEVVVWDALMKYNNYRECTAAFKSVGGNQQHELKEGSAVLVCTPDGNELVSRVIRHQHAKVISIQHEGILKNGEIDHLHPAAKHWIGLYQIYRAYNVGNKTRLDVEQDIAAGCVDLFSRAWRQTLEMIKIVSEEAA